MASKISNLLGIFGKYCENVLFLKAVIEVQSKISEIQNGGI